MSKIIGLTGGIGSGKTTVAHFFEEVGIPVFYSDEVAKVVTNKDQTLQIIKKVFGATVFDGAQLDRKKLAEVVFADENQLLKLNNIIHPLVKIEFELWKSTHKTEPFLIKESAVLFESGSYKECDFVINVIAPLDERINRVIKRDSIAKEQVEARINNQWNDEMRSKNSHFNINNDTLLNVKKQVIEILKSLKNI